MNPQQDHTPNTPTATDSDGIPIHAGPGVSGCCWVSPGQPHALSCDVVTPEQALAFIASR